MILQYKQYRNFNWTNSWYLSSFGVTWPSNFGCYTFGKRILPLTRSQPAVLSCTRLIYL